MPRHSPGLFQQIALRFAVLIGLFILVEIALTLAGAVLHPGPLATEFLTVEAGRIARSGPDLQGLADRPAGTLQWIARLVEPGDPLPGGTDPAILVDWTVRELTATGERITGLRPIEVDGERRWLYLAFEAEGWAAYVPLLLGQLLWQVALPLIALCLCLMLAGAFALRQVLDPLRVAEREAEALDAENINARLSVPPAPRELAALAKALNRALDRIAVSTNSIRMFTANAAHELRTPLSILRVSLERLPPSQLRRELEEDCDDMIRLANQMLDLAEADTLSIEEAEIISLADVTQDAIRALAPISQEDKRQVRLDVRDPGPVRAHSDAVFLMIRNIIDNALMHTPSGSPIEVTVGPGPCFSVRDHGPGIKPIHQKHIFERFWRGERRSGEGSGLGLGIVKRLVDVHGATITVSNPPDGGALFTVNFPAPMPATLRRVNRA